MNSLTQPILIVEDNEDDVFVINRALKKAQIAFPTQLVRDGEKAIAYLSGAGEFSDRATYPLPFLVFLDLKLPYVNGAEVLRWIKREPALASLPVVALTSSAEIKDMQSAYAAGARSYLTKPPTPESLLTVFESLGSSWLLAGAAPGLMPPGLMRPGMAARRFGGEV